MHIIGFPDGGHRHEHGRHTAPTAVLRRARRGTELSAGSGAALHHAAGAVDRDQSNSSISSACRCSSATPARSRSPTSARRGCRTVRDGACAASTRPSTNLVSLSQAQSSHPAGLPDRHRCRRTVPPGPALRGGLSRNHAWSQRNSTSPIRRPGWPTAPPRWRIIRPPVDLPDHRMLILDCRGLGGLPTAGSSARRSGAR